MTKIIILTVSHGASHTRAGRAIQEALAALRPELEVRIVDALEECAPWFRAYYNSYTIPLRLWPSLWGWIEKLEHDSSSTAPGWLYRRGGKRLFDFLARETPNGVIATEVGIGELAAMAKRRGAFRGPLAGVLLWDYTRAWVQPEFDLYLASHSDLANELVAAGAPAASVVTVGQAVDKRFYDLPDRAEIRRRLDVETERPLILVLFGGAGFGKPAVLIRELQKIRRSAQFVFVAGRNARLEADVRKDATKLNSARVLGWVDNMHEWTGAADLVVSKPGPATFFEAAACGTPLLAIHPLPGNEVRACDWIEKWGTGVWVRRASDLSRNIESLLDHPEELNQMREKIHSLARPHAAEDAARAVLDLL